VESGHSPRYCNRRRFPEKATALRGGKAREEEDPRVRIPALNPWLSFLRVEERMRISSNLQAGGKENE